MSLHYCPASATTSGRNRRRAAAAGAEFAAQMRLRDFWLTVHSATRHEPALIGFQVPSMRNADPITRDNARSIAETEMTRSVPGD